MRSITCIFAALPLALALSADQPAAQAKPPAKPRPRAQTPADPRFAIGLSGGFQPTVTDFDDRFTFPLHQETGTSTVDYSVESGGLFDANFGVRLWGGLGAGVAVSRFTGKGNVTATSSVPHPFYLERYREVSGEADGIDRNESGVHVQLQYRLPLRGPLQVTLMAGPSFLNVTQTMVIDVNYTEEYPYDVATFAGVDSRRVKASAPGFNAGLDLRWMFTRNIGVGGLARFTRAEVELDAADDRTVTVDAGGAHVGAGIRFAF